MGTPRISPTRTRTWVAGPLAAFLLTACTSTGRVSMNGPMGDAPRPVSDASRVRLVSLNVAMLPGPLGHRNVERAERIADRLVATPGPDVIVLLEVFDEAARRTFARRLGRTHPWMVSKAKASEVLREDSGLFLASRIPFVVRERPRVQFQPFRTRGPVQTADHWVAKGTLAAELDLGTGASLCLLATHLQSDDERIGEHASVRARQLEEVRRFATRFVDGVEPSRRRSVLLVGDLNVCGESCDTGPLRPTAEYRALLARLGGPRDLFRERHPTLPGHTWNVDRTAPGAIASQPAQRLDYALELPARHAPSRAAPVRSTAMRTVALDSGLSDHAGLALEALFGGTAPPAIASLSQ